MLVNYLSIVSGSLTELDTHLVIANKLGYLTKETRKELGARMGMKWDAC